MISALRFGCFVGIGGSQQSSSCHPARLLESFFSLWYRYLLLVMSPETVLQRAPRSGVRCGPRFPRETRTTETPLSDRPYARQAHLSSSRIPQSRQREHISQRTLLALSVMAAEHQGAVLRQTTRRSGSMFARRLLCERWRVPRRRG